VTAPAIHPFPDMHAILDGHLHNLLELILSEQGKERACKHRSCYAILGTPTHVWLPLTPPCSPAHCVGLHGLDLLLE
jgi:hypothetical protein